MTIERTDAKEIKIPLALLAAGIVITGIQQWFLSGTAGMAIAVVATLILLVITVPLGVIACLITGRIMDTDFGLLIPGIIKLAAVFVFPGAVASIIPLPWLLQVCISLVLYWGLLEWLFEMEALELCVLIVVIFIVRLLAIILAAGVIVAIRAQMAGV